MKHLNKKARIKSGFTMAEMLIAMAICSMILITIAIVIQFTAHNVRKITNESEGSKNVSFTLEYLRYTLSMADYSTAVISNANHRIEFQDPNLLGIESAFEFKGGHLWYDRDTSDMEEGEVGGHLINMTFTPIFASTVIHVDSLSRGRSGEIEGQPIQISADIYLRNY